METSHRHVLALAGSVAVAVLALGQGASAQTPRKPHAACQVEGVWEQVSVTFDGHEMPPHSRPMRKIVAHGYFIEIGAEAGRDKLPQRTDEEKLRANEIFGGSGTYTTTDSTFTQHIDYFSFPSWEGAKVVASCRTEGELWHYTFSTAGIPGTENGPKHVSEVWRRVR